MDNENQSTQKQKKTRKRRSTEKMAELVLEAERVGAGHVCKREGLAPAQLSRWKQKFLQGGIQSLKEIKRVCEMGSMVKALLKLSLVLNELPEFMNLFKLKSTDSAHSIEEMLKEKK